MNTITILHKPRQLSCRNICKIMTLFDYKGNDSNKNSFKDYLKPVIHTKSKN